MSPTVDLPAIRACLFDMDGLLIDSEDLYTICTNEVLREYGKPDLPWKIKAQLQGRPGPEAQRIFHAWAQLPINNDEFMAKQRVLQQKYFPMTKPLPGAQRLLTTLAQHSNPRILLALATSSHAGNFELKTGKLHHFFAPFKPENRVLGDDLRIPRGRGKPAPDIYLLALETINESLRKTGEQEIKPEECLVFEDSVPGVEAGRRAGMQVVWCPHPELLQEYKGREKEVLAGLTGEYNEDEGQKVAADMMDDVQGKEQRTGRRVPGQAGEIDDGWGRLLNSLEDFPYDAYGIEVQASFEPHESKQESSDSTEYPLYLRNISYGTDHRLQTVDLWLPRPLPPSPLDDKTAWVIFLHGGAWRDPTQDSREIEPTQHLLLSTPSPHLPHIAGIASINYGLSPYASHLTSPSSPDDPARNAKHPDHLNDVLKCLRWLRKTHGMRRWIAVGHSCGATLAFQALMARAAPGQDDRSSLDRRGQEAEDSFVPLLAIVGLAGLYDLPALRRNHADQPVYGEILRGAFGPDENAWEAASPVVGKYAGLWPEGGLVVLGWGERDGLVEEAQLQGMVQCLEGEGWVRSGSEGRGRKELVVLSLKGEHDDVWKEGTQMVEAIELVLARLFESEG